MLIIDDAESTGSRVSEKEKKKRVRDKTRIDETKRERERRTSKARR